MIRGLVVMVIGMFTLPTAHTQSTAANAKLNQALKAIVTDAKKPLASLSALAIRDGKVVYEGHFGQRVIDVTGAGKDIAPDTDTLYRIASVSKLVTAIGAMRLVDEGRLDLDTDVSRYLGFELRNPNFPKAPITTRMLLNHTSSLRDDAGYFWGLEVRLKDVLTPGGKLFGKGGVWVAAQSNVSLEPGKFFHYVNLNYGVLGTVIEAITQERFDLYMKRAVLQPLAIKGAFTPEGLSQDDVNHTAVLYRKGQDGDWNSAGPWVPQTDNFQGKLPAVRAGLATYVPGSNATGFGPQGGLRISVRGLARILQMLMNGGELDGVRVLQSASITAMQRHEWNYTDNPANGDTLAGAFYAWGLGLQRFTDRSGVVKGDRLVAAGGLTGFGHLGIAYGLQSMLFYDPVRRLGLIYAIGGTGVDPELNKGQYSSFYSWEESIVDTLYRLALAE